MSLRIRPLSLRQANAIVTLWHRHHKEVRGHRFSLGAYDGDEIVGVAMIGRPVAREVDPWKVAEVNRVATNGHRNACSFLYAAATRVAREMGFEQLWTYTLDSEPGTSLNALKQLGWRSDGIVRKDGVGWNNREDRKTDQPTGAKKRWRVVFNRGDLI